MKQWWLKRSLKLRLALWYAVVTAFVLTAFAWFVFEVIEHRLGAELDRQLRIDFDLAEAQLDLDEEGRVQFTVHGSHGDEGFARLSAWFEVWSENGQLLFRHWPVPESNIRNAPPAPKASTLRFHTIELEHGLFVRLMERPARIHGRGVIVRLFRDESELRRTLREIVEVSALGLPLAVLLASVGGYLIARRSLASVGAVADEAQKITSESLSERLPNPNPHDELGRLVSVFNALLERLEGSFLELKRFTADASHELRSPLTALRTVGEVGLRSGDDPTVLRETIGSMLEEAQRLHELIEALLALARMDRSNVPLKLERVSVRELLQEVREHLGILAVEKQQTLEVSGEVDLKVTADCVLLRQAVINIVHNAIRYSTDGSSIALRALQRRGEALIEVQDQGPGIAAEYRDKIFERFYRIDKARSRSEGGTGLGLAIAKRAVELQGGRIELESELGRGSLFRIVLPLNGEGAA